MIGKVKILVVEDEPVVARDVAQQLQELGYTPIGHARHGKEAIDLAGQLAPHLVLMDIQLPGNMDGITAAHAIRAQHFIPVVFLSAFSADEVLSRAKLAEPYGYILKPFTQRELRTVLEMALYKHQAELKQRATSRELQSLSRRVLEIQEAERRRVALELHDELGQTLTAIKINLQLNERVLAEKSGGSNQESLRMVEDALLQVRSLAMALRPAMLDDLGLGAALKWLAELTEKRHGFSVLFHSDIDRLRFSPEMETACFRIAQEALTNVIRHAKAHTVEIHLSRIDDEMLLMVKDDGVGFDLLAARQQALSGASMGVRGMHERVMLVGGELQIETRLGGGSVVRFRCPLLRSEVAA